MTAYIKVSTVPSHLRQVFELQWISMLTQYNKSSDLQQTNIFLQGGDSISVQSFSLTYASYTWTYKKPFKLTGYADKVCASDNTSAFLFLYV